MLTLHLLSHLRFRTVAFVAAGAIAFLAAGCGPLPDLQVQANQKSNHQCDGAILRFDVSAKITNNGSGAVKLESDWTKPWVTGYPSTPIPNFVKPSQTGTAVTLKQGESTTVEFPVSLNRSQDGVAYDFIVEVDPSNAIQESNENNNSSKIPITAKICG